MLAAPPLWRSAIRFARGRPLCGTAPCSPEEVDRNRLILCGVAHLRQAIEFEMPDLWGRLRFRLDKSTVDAAQQEACRWKIHLAGDVDVRQIRRAWRFGAAPQA